MVDPVLPLLVGAWIGDWSPAVGDPTVLGWVTVGAYLAAAWSCWRARAVARRSEHPDATRGSAVFWTVLTAGLGALALNKQLDLQSAVAEFGRTTVRSLGWDDHRETMHRGLVFIVVLLAVTTCAWMAVLARRELGRVGLALLGWAGLCIFVSIRAASFHHVDRMLGLTWAGASLNAVVELGGVALVALGGVTYGRAPLS